MRAGSERRVKIPPHELTFLAEDLGLRRPVPLRYLAALATHPDPIVREGAVYGLAPHARAHIAMVALQQLAELDPSPEVRAAAAEALA